MLRDRSWPKAPAAKGWQRRHRLRPSRVRRCSRCSSSSGAHSLAERRAAVHHRTRLRACPPCLARCRNV